MTDNVLVSKDALTVEIVQKCLHIYPEVVEAVYKATRRMQDQARILESDRWRYKLSAEVGPVDGLTKKELNRLVQWKICHGTNRPFLPGMVDKNSPEEVKTCTTAAAKHLLDIDSTSSEADITSSVKKALSEACKLKGIGPATGTLILSIFKPNIIPFFQDETFYWITSDYSKKLKYDKKEYAIVLEEVLKLREKLGVEAVKLEKTAYVLSHVNALSDDQGRRLKRSIDAKLKAAKKPATDAESGQSKEASTKTTKRKRPVSESKDADSSGIQEKSDKEPASKRQSKRQKGEAAA